MKIQCTKEEFRRCVTSCNEGSCVNCAIYNLCTRENEAGEGFAAIVEIIPDEESEEKDNG